MYDWDLVGVFYPTLFHGTRRTTYICRTQKVNLAVWPLLVAGGLSLPPFHFHDTGAFWPTAHILPLTPIRPASLLPRHGSVVLFVYFMLLLQFPLPKSHHFTPPPPSPRMFALSFPRLFVLLHSDPKRAPPPSFGPPRFIKIHVLRRAPPRSVHRWMIRAGDAFPPFVRR